MESAVVTIWWLVAAYLLVGAAVAGMVHARGLRVIDPATVGAGLAFRLLITPGLIALWPLMAAKQRRVASGVSPAGQPDCPLAPRTLRRLHGLFIVLLAILLPLAVGLALAYRPAPSPFQSVPSAASLAP